MNTMRTESDAELLKAYAERDDQGAFEEIVSRYGSLVYRVCFHKLVNRHDAEDASQAVFMALFKNASRLKRESSLACWLHTVARQTSLFMARTRIRRSQREAEAAEILDTDRHPPVNEDERKIILKYLDEELASLSVSQREAIILRYYQHGRSESETSYIAGCAANTLSRRASDGILNLRKRLLRRGCALGVPALIGVLESDAQAAIPQTLIPSLLAIPKLAAAGASAGTTTANIIFLMEGALKAMAITKIKTAGIGILIALLIGTTAVVAVKEVQKWQNSNANEPPGIVKSNEDEKIKDQPKSLTDDKSLSKNNISKAKQPPRSRDFQGEAELAIKEENWETLTKVMEEWAKAAPVLAAEWAIKLPEGAIKERMTVLRLVALGWAEKDPVVAAEWAMKLPEGYARHNGLIHVASKWAENDPVAAAEWAMKLPDREGKANPALGIVAHGWAEKDPVAAAEWAMKLPEGETRNSACHTVVVTWASTDPVAATEWAMKLPEGEARDSALSSVAVGWALTDPVSAAELLLKLPEGKGKTQALEWVVEQCAIKDPVTAYKLAMRLPDGQFRNDALLKVATGWARTDPAAAADWALSLPEGKGKDGALTNVVDSWAAKDPVAAAEWIMRWPNGMARGNELGSVAFSWAQKDPIPAAEWAMKLPEGEARDSALSSVAVGWALTDPVSTAEWVLKLPGGRAKDSLMPSMAVQWAQKDPAAASEWALRLPEGNGKTMTLTNVVVAWAQKDPKKAHKWLEESSLSQEEKDRLLKKIESLRNSP